MYLSSNRVEAEWSIDLYFIAWSAIQWRVLYLRQELRGFPLGSFLLCNCLVKGCTMLLYLGAPLLFLLFFSSFSFAPSLYSLPFLIESFCYLKKKNLLPFLHMYRYHSDCSFPVGLKFNTCTNPSKQTAALVIVLPICKWKNHRAQQGNIIM